MTDDHKVISTGFPTLDKLLGGGLQSNEISIMVSKKGSPTQFLFPYTPSQAAILKEAIIFALERHEGQLDKSGQEPYMDHVLRVMLRCKTLEARVVAMLHDVVEDGRAELWEITERFGNHYSYWTEKLDRHAAESEEEYYRIIKEDIVLLEVKTADIDDNTDPIRLARLDEKTSERLKEKYHKARVALGLYYTY
jgi:(p)ppGpp synthase/HD superfamily hydrolase